MDTQISYIMSVCRKENFFENVDTYLSHVTARRKKILQTSNRKGWLRDEMYWLINRNWCANTIPTH